ncbi:MAG TPA: tetratricopeptide repeat protein, partial [Nannocystaceae bacterium]|nr:tetratricopeptide repeat protein [Nannocystaceae bacterium]
LVAALDRGRRSARRRPWVIAGIAVVAIAGALVVHDRVQQIRRAAACDDDAAIADASWPGAHDEVRVGVRDVVERELGDDAAATLARVEPTLDGYVASWRELAAERCRAWTVEAHEPTLAAAALRCLHERRAVLDTLLARVQEGDAAVLRRAIKAVHALPPLDGCGDPEALRRRGALGERDPEAVAAVRDRVARSRGLQLAGDIAAARDEGEQARADAIAVEWPPVLAEAELQLGSALEASGAYAESESVLADAYMTARACDSSLVAMDAAIALGVVIGSRQARAEEGLRWVRLAEVEYQRLGSPPSLSATRLYNSESAIYFATGDLDAALAQSEKALALREQLLAADDPEIAQSLANLGAIRFRRGDLEEARSLLRRALTQCRDSLGPDHFDCVNFAANLGGIAQTLGDYDEAETALRDAMRIREHVLGPDHPDFASSLGDIAALRMLAGDYLGARELDERALAIVRKIHGEGHPLLAPFMSRLSSDDYALGRFELARDEIAESVAMRERHLGADAIDTALARIDLGACELALQHTHEALREGERALPVIEAAMGAADPNVARALLLIGGAHKLRGEHATALPLFERAVALLDAAPVPAHERAAGHFQLAEVLWASAPARARELATRALAEYSEVGFQGDRERNEVRAWIAAHP